MVAGEQFLIYLITIMVFYNFLITRKKTWIIFFNLFILITIYYKINLNSSCIIFQVVNKLRFEFSINCNYKVLITQLLKNRRFDSSKQIFLPRTTFKIN